MMHSEIVEQVRKWGGSTSDAVLDPACTIFQVPGLQGLIGYRFASNCAFVFGDPLCPEQTRSQLVEAFHAFCKTRRKKVVYVIASEEFTRWSLGTFCKGAIQFGEELFLDPHKNPREGPKGSLARRKVRHALNEGVTVHEYSETNAHLQEPLQNLAEEWLNRRKGPQVYISHVRLFDDRFGKRWFYAICKNTIVGIVTLNQLQSKQGWLLNHLMLASDAPNGTSEFLVITAIDTLAKEGCSFVTFGAVPCLLPKKIEGFGLFHTWMARMAFKMGHIFFRLEGKQKFWEKFQPQGEPRYLLFSHPYVGPKELFGLMKALNISF